MKLSFDFTIEETNLILESLRELQFKRVIELMRRIETSAQEQLKQPEVYPVIEE